MRSTLRLLPVPATLALLVLALLLPGQAAAGTRILGGQPIQVSQTPYVASIDLHAGTDSVARCSGVIIDPRRILTSGHCFDEPGVGIDGGVVRVGSSTQVPLPGDAGAQELPIESFRVHPGHVPNAVAVTPDDIAVITLGGTLDLSGANAKAIPLAAPGAYPAAGAQVIQAGYGRQIAGVEPDDRLYGRIAAVLAPDTCGASNAVELCYSAPTNAGCQGDSGGPIVVGGVLAGVNSSGECVAGQSGLAATIAAPEIRAFIDGAASLPLAPRQTAGATISGFPVEGRQVLCAPGAWSNAPGYTFTFQDARDGTVLQTGASSIRTLTASDVGRPVRCLISATTPGGTGFAATGTTPAVTAAPAGSTTAPPTAAAPGGPTVQVVASTLRRRARSLVRVDVFAGTATLDRYELCVSTSKRAKVVQRTGSLHPHTRACRTYASIAAGAGRRVSLRVRSTSRGSVRITATIRRIGTSTRVTASKTVRAR